MRCKECRFFKWDSEYKNVGDCSKIFKEFIHVQYAEAWFVEPEFGCIYGERAAETSGTSEDIAQQAKTKMPVSK